MSPETVKSFVKSLLNKKEPQLKDTQFAELFAQNSNAIFYFDSETEHWYHYNKRHWVARPVEILKKEVVWFLKNHPSVRNLGSVNDSFLNSTISYLKTVLCKPDNIKWDSHQDYLPLKDDLLNLSEGKLLNHSENFYNRLSLPYNIEEAFYENAIPEDQKIWDNLLNLYKQKCASI